MAVILVADSGSTKTEWALVRKGEVETLRTEGYNPYFDREVSWAGPLSAWLSSLLVQSEERVEVFYYGAGCDRPEAAARVEAAFREILPGARVHVADDLSGAGAALWHHEQGGVLILGTGMNAGMWDGRRITKKITPMGFLLGDHGSGAALGLRLARAWLDGDLQEETSRKLQEKYRLDREMLKKNAYLEPRPHYFFAGFTPFFLEAPDDPVLQRILEDEFDRLFRCDLQPLLGRGSFRALGSVAWYFREKLHEKAERYGLHLDKVVRYPLNELVVFHGENIR